MFTRRRTGKQGVNRGAYDGGSLVFDGSTQYLDRTASLGNRRTWTFRCRVKKCALGSRQLLFGGRKSNTNPSYDYTAVWLFENDTIRIFSRTGNVTKLDVSTVPLFRDTHAHYDICVGIDTTQTPASDRITIEVNGTVMDYTTSVTPSLNLDTWVNYNFVHRIGARIEIATPNAAFLNGYISNAFFIDGTKYSASTFGETSADTLAWVDKSKDDVDAAITYGTNGFHLTFDSEDGDTTSVTDQSGNGNDWTENGYSSAVGSSYSNDTMIDNYATLNPLMQISGGTYLSNGNLQIDPNDGNFRALSSTISVSSGKWYFEVHVDNIGSGFMVGVLGTDDTISATDYIGQRANGYSFYGDSANFRRYNNGSYSTYGDGASYQTGDYVGCALDLDNGAIWFNDNGTWVDTDGSSSSAAVLAEIEAGTTTNAAFTGLTGSFTCGASPAGSVGQATVRFDPDKWEGSAPQGFNALTSANLPEPTIKLPKKFADILLYTGDASDPREIDGAEFQPDFVWFKNRDTTASHQLYDSIRGATKPIYSNLTNAEATQTNGLESFDSDGFTVGSHSGVNGSGNDMFSLLLKAGGAGVANTDGTISSTVSYGNGFSIVTYTGTGSAGTVGHGGTLGRAPDMIICKKRSTTSSWNIYHSANTSAPETENLQFDTDATSDLSTPWNDTLPSSNVFTAGTANSDSGVNHVAYCFWFDKGEGDTPYVGGSYTGNGNADGTFIPTDELQLFLMKRTSAIGDWIFLDQERSPYNVADLVLRPNTSNTDTVANEIDFLSNGIKHRNADAGSNASGSTFIWFGIKKIDTAYS